MGHLTYAGNALRTHFDDRLLTHLQIVILKRLRNKESFAFSWVIPAADGAGRTTIWVHPAANLVFSFEGSRVPAVNELWLRALLETAYSPAGLRLVPEPAAAATPPMTPHGRLAHATRLAHR